MKPRNKKQQHIVELSGRLRPLTTAQKQWAFSHTIDHYAYRLKSGKAVCMDCGHEWQEVGFDIYRCPNCGDKVEIRNTKERVHRDKSYFNVITTMEDYQVIRMFLMKVEMRKGMKAEPAYLEIGQYWIDPKGHATVVGLQRKLGYYVDSFAFGSPLEIRGDNDVFRHIASQWVYPRIKMLERMGRDLHSPSLVASKDLKHAHDEYVEKVNRQRTKEQRETNRKKAEADQAKFEELKGRFIGLTMTDGTIRLHTLDSVADYYEEGTRQHICVGSAGYYLKADTLVFTATMGGKTIATVEISLKDYSIVQCRAFANKVCEYTEQIAGIINANKKLIAERKRA